MAATREVELVADMEAATREVALVAEMVEATREVAPVAEMVVVKEPTAAWEEKRMCPGSGRRHYCCSCHCHPSSPLSRGEHRRLGT